MDSFRLSANHSTIYLNAKKVKIYIILHTHTIQTNHTARKYIFIKRANDQRLLTSLCVLPVLLGFISVIKER